MNTSFLDKFKRHYLFYQFLYIFITISILTILLLLMLFLKNYTTLTYKGIVKDNQDLVISNLTKDDTNLILNSKLLIENEKINYKVLDIYQENIMYTVKLELNKFFLDSRSIKVKFIVKEENLLEFIIRKVKGDLWLN